MMLKRKEEMLNIVDKILKTKDRTPAWLCRQAGVHRCNYSLIKKGQQKLSSNLMDKFSKILGISKDVLFPNYNQES